MAREPVPREPVPLSLVPRGSCDRRDGGAVFILRHQLETRSLTLAQWQRERRNRVHVSRGSIGNGCHVRKWMQLHWQ